MNQFDLFYKAYESYKAEFDKNRDNILFKKANFSEMEKKNFLSSIKVECKVEEDWVQAIERGVYYIAKAIKEDRQFIRNEGDVLPIEKIRRVSKDSIVDLSKHSNYITKKPEEGANIIPEKLLMINRENDYAIYENRVIYTILLYLKEFVGSRVDVLTQVLNKYEGKCSITKSLETGDRKLDFELKFTDIRNNDDIAIRNNKFADTVAHLTNILNDIIILLNTPLMVEMSKHPTVSRPIIKTNVLKMNTNFKEALACYDYICAYTEPGYELKVYEDTICPLTKEQQDSFADIMLLSTFLGYEFNNHLEKELAKNYKEEQKINLAKEAKEHLEKINQIKEKSPEELNEYLVMLEDGYNLLESRIKDLEETLDFEKKTYQESLEAEENLRVTEIRRLEIDHEERMEALIKEYEERIQTLINDYEAKINDIINDYESRIETLTNEYETRIETMTNEYETRIETLTNDYETTISILKEESSNKINELSTSLETMTNDYNQTKDQLDFYSKEKEEFVAELRQREVLPLEGKIAQLEEDLANARTILMGKELADDKHAYNPTMYTSKEDFTNLEKQKNAFDKFFNEAWKATKKEIKKKHYSLKKEGDE